jgi:hypothetical protein
MFHGCKRALAHGETMPYPIPFLESYRLLRCWARISTGRKRLSYSSSEVYRIRVELAAQLSATVPRCSFTAGPESLRYGKEQLKEHLFVSKTAATFTGRGKNCLAKFKVQGFKGFKVLQEVKELDRGKIRRLRFHPSGLRAGVALQQKKAFRIQIGGLSAAVGPTLAARRRSRHLRLSGRRKPLHQSLTWYPRSREV